MNVFDLVAVLSLDSKNYEEGLGSAEKQGSSFGKGLVTAGKVGAAAIAATTAVVVGGTKALVDGTSQVAEYGDNVDKMSQKIGISAESYQEWDAIMQHCGASVDSLQPSMKTLSTQAQKGNEAFQQLGISQEEVASLSQEDLFAKVVAGLQDMEEGTERTYIASQLLGRGATELGALFNTSAEETEAMRNRVHELGGVMSDDAVKAAAKYQDTLQDMKTGFEGLKRGLTSEFMPAITTVMEGLTDIFSGNMDEGLEKISEGIETVVSQITEKLPEILELGAGILKALGKGILDNLPMILSAAVDIILELMDGLIKALPMLVDSALQIILALADGLIQMLPELIPAIVDVVIQITETLIDNLDLLIDASIQIIFAIIEGLDKATPQLVEKMPEIIQKLLTALIKSAPLLMQAGVKMVIHIVTGWTKTLPMLLKLVTELIPSIVTGIAEGLPKMLQIGQDIVDEVSEALDGLGEKALNWGKDLIDNFVDGIKGGIDKVGSAAKSIGSTVKDFIGFSEPDKGPLSNFHTFAPDMIDLFTQGIEDGKNQVADAMADLGGVISGEITSNNIETAGGGTSDLIAYLEQFKKDIMNQQIVLDSGALVGGIANKMDNALGQRQLMARKGVIA